MNQTVETPQVSSDKHFSEEMMAYLSLIQEPIGRLSTASSVFKGFAATIVTGIAALSYAEIGLPLLILSFIPILAFAALDIYYLRLEKCYRGLYNDVLNGEHEVDFSIAIPHDRAFIERAKASVINCMASPSIWLFYPAMFLVLIIVCVLKIRGGL